jgi:hypothetical protein
MIKVGDTLTIEKEIIAINGAIVLEKDEKVIVSELMIKEAHWSRLCPDIWIPEDLIGIMLENKYGIYSPQTFKEFNI